MAFTLRQETASGFTTKGSALSYAEGDNNFIGLYNRDDLRLPLSGGTLTGALTISSGNFNVASGQILSGGTDIATLWGGGGGASDLNGLADVEVVNGITPLAFSMFLSNGTSPGAPPQHGTLNNASRNLAIMAGSLASITSGDSNICIGFYAGNALTTQGGNVLIGDSAGQLITDANAKTTAIGFGALDAATTGTQNTALGYNAGSAVTLGDFNTLLGSGSGDGLQNADKNIMIGYEADGAANSDYQIAIGSQVATTQTASLSLGQSGAILLHGDFATAGQTQLGVNLGNTWTQPTATLHVKGEGTTSGTVSLLVEDSAGVDLVKVTDDGALTINEAFTLPTTDGTPSQVLQTDGAGSVTWATAGGGGASAIGDLSDATTPATDNIGLGSGALGSLSTGDYNTALGIGAGDSISTGEQNIAIGWNALDGVSTGSYNTVIGSQALDSASFNGSNNVAIGTICASDSTTGNLNVYIGYNTARYSASNNNVVIGSSSCQNSGNLTTGYNTIVGQGSSNSLTSGQQNQAFGYGSNAGTTGSFNTCLGRGIAGTTGTFNMSLGVTYTGTHYQTGNYSTRIGSQISASSTSASYEVILGGNNRLLFNGDYTTAGQAKMFINPGASVATPSATLHVKGQGNTNATQSLLIESSTKTLMRLYDSGDSIAIGANAGFTSGNAANISIGTSACFFPSGANNISIGNNALQGSSSANSNGNVAIGQNSLKDVVDARRNVAIGQESGANVTGGDNNTLLGAFAGDNLTTGSDNIIIGYLVDASSASVSNELNIGDQIVGSMDATDQYTTFNGQVYTPTSTLTSGANISVDFTNGNVYTVDLANNAQLDNPSNLKDGATYIIIVKQTGSFTMSFDTAYKFESGSAPTITTGAGAVDILTFVSDGTSLYGAAAQNFS